MGGRDGCCASQAGHPGHACPPGLCLAACRPAPRSPTATPPYSAPPHCPHPWQGVPGGPGPGYPGEQRQRLRLRRVWQGVRPGAARRRQQLTAQQRGRHGGARHRADCAGGCFCGDSDALLLSAGLKALRKQRLPLAAARCWLLPSAFSVLACSPCVLPLSCLPAMRGQPAQQHQPLPALSAVAAPSRLLLLRAQRGCPA